MRVSLMRPDHTKLSEHTTNTRERRRRDSCISFCTDRIRMRVSPTIMKEIDFIRNLTDVFWCCRSLEGSSFEIGML